MSAWIDQIFEANIVMNQGVVRRQIDDVKTYSSEQELVEEVKRRGFHLIQTGEQYVILCNQGAIKIWC